MPVWTPFQRAHNYASPEKIEAMFQDCQRLAPNATADQIRAMIQESLSAEVWKNSVYTVAVSRNVALMKGWPETIHLSIKRNDRAPVGEEHFRDFQRIKNELIGPACEAVELYPAEERLVDTANQYHLWVLADPTTRFPFGFGGRLIAGSGGISGAQQRPFEEEGV